jgi:hypothetical protein
MPPISMKKWIAALWLLFLATIVSGFFWYNQLIYILPTPVPEGYHGVKNGHVITIGKELKFNNNKPVFLHFFNPDCPCSRFNISHFKSLVKTYGANVNFAIVLMTDKPYTASEMRKRFNIDVPVIRDSSLALATGVYSTPQAVILQGNRKLYYRGNYNKTRYCTDEKTSYAKIALDNLLADHKSFQFDRLALQAYGCTLPNCKN